MSSNWLNPLDASWLYTESPDTPMHVGALLVFAMPPGAPKDFLRRVVADFRAHRDAAPPWNRRLGSSRLTSLLPEWVEVEGIDTEVHVRRTALPFPGGERELGELIARLHSQPLDLSRPPWECTLIEGLDAERFAIYVKLHHCLVDGTGGAKLLQRSLPADRDKSLAAPPFWAAGPAARQNAKHGRGRDTAPPGLASRAAGAIDAWLGQLAAVPQTVLSLVRMLHASSGSGGTLRAPFSAPASVLNGRVRGRRRFATQQFPLDRMKAIAAAAGCTVNDIVLAICGGALRRFLDDRGELPATALTAGIPVSVRPQDDESTGNAITFILATLGTDIDDAAERLAAIRASVQSAKAHVRSLPRPAMTPYTVALMAPTLLALLTGLAGRTRPMFNIAISNVPGPDHALYFRGAELLAAYPVSIVTHGQALNITCHSYNGNMAFGFTGCHASLPHMQRIAVYTGEALDELERRFAAPPKAKSRRPRRSPSAPARPVAAGRAQARSP